MLLEKRLAQSEMSQRIARLSLKLFAILLKVGVRHGGWPGGVETILPSGYPIIENWPSGCIDPCFQGESLQIVRIGLK
jgi:hypothetical protein